MSIISSISMVFLVKSVDWHRSEPTRKEAQVIPKLISESINRKRNSTLVKTCRVTGAVIFKVKQLLIVEIRQIINKHCSKFV